jgi:3',5'-cyclic AMP phosphodiesterase CpdA
VAAAQTPAKLLAVSDLHVAYDENRAIVAELRPHSDKDWLVVAGDVAEMAGDIEWALRQLRSRFATVVWAPGNHELWTPKTDPVQLRGEARYQYLVRLCREIGVITPEDPYPVWEGPDGPVTVAPLFLLYDYTFRPPGVASKEAALALAHETGIVCADEYLLHPDPYPSREAWCEARLALTERRLSEVDPQLSTILVNHFPLVREPTRVLWHPEFAIWCGTERTADWHRRFRADAVIYGHLHIPRGIVVDGVPFEEVSLGYPREWLNRSVAPNLPRQILPRPGLPRPHVRAARA